MLTLPIEIITLLAPFAPLFSPTVFQHAQLLLVGAMLTPGQRTVTAALRALGLSHCRQYQNFHRVLNRAVWSPRQTAGLLLRLLVQVFVPTGPLLIGGDDTIERRRGAKIAAKGIYRDPVRSSHGHFVKTSGLRWLCLMLLVPVPFAKRIWALPFLTLLAPSERAQATKAPQRRRSKTLLDWMRQGFCKWRCKWGVGCPNATWCWWQIRVTPPWSCWPLCSVPADVVPSGPNNASWMFRALSPS